MRTARGLCLPRRGGRYRRVCCRTPVRCAGAIRSRVRMEKSVPKILLLAVEAGAKLHAALTWKCVLKVFLSPPACFARPPPCV